MHSRRQIIPSVEEAIRVLLLCSYDEKTLGTVELIIEKLKEIYDPDFRGRIMPIVAKNVKILEARSQKERYLIFSEKFQDKWSLTLFKQGKIIENAQCTEDQLGTIAQKIEEAAKKDLGECKEIMTTTKIMELSEWADLIAVIKHVELGRGGELIELAMIVCAHLFKKDMSVHKTILLRRDPVTLSWMANEMIQLGALRQKSYKDFDELLVEFKQQVDLITERKRLERI